MQKHTLTKAFTSRVDAYHIATNGTLTDGLVWMRIQMLIYTRHKYPRYGFSGEILT